MEVKRIIAFVIMLLGFSGISTVLHEFGHFLTNNLLGGAGEIYLDFTLTSGHMDWIKVPAHHIWLVYLGGGLFTAFFLFIFMWLPPRLTPTKADVYVEAAVAGYIMSNLLYAPVELLLYTNHQKLYQWGSVAAGLIAAILLAVFYIVKLGDWADIFQRKITKSGK